MSRIRIVGGSITKTSKGATTLEALDGNLVMIAAKQIILDGGENGITHHEYVPPKKKEEDKVTESTPLEVKCIVQFRPTGTWKGEFGFDWFRTGDTGRKGDVNYETLVGQYYDRSVGSSRKVLNTNSNKWTRYFKADPQPEGFSASDRIQRLKQLYGIYQYSVENDSSGSSINKEYYRPVLALFARQADPLNPSRLIETGKAQLDLYIEFMKKGQEEIKPSKLIFEMDGVLMNESHPHVSINRHTILESQLSNKIENIEITCKEEFAEDKEIIVWAISVDEAGKQTARLEAGRLKIIATAKQRTKNIVVVLVKSGAGEVQSARTDILTKILRQSLIRANVVTEGLRNNVLSPIIIDVSIPSNNPYNQDFNTLGKVEAVGKYKNFTTPTQGRIDALIHQTLARDYNDEYTDYFKLFILANYKDLTLDEEKGTPLNYTRGYAPLGNNYGVMLGGHDKFTIAHECLHGLGLPHSFFSDSFLYQALKTDNIMDYSHLEFDPVAEIERDEALIIDRISSWYWQWQILNNL